MSKIWIITKDSESWKDIAVPAYIPADIDDFICGYHLAQIRPDFADITRFGVGKYWIDNSLFPVPPIGEQQAINQFIESETIRIDCTIAKIEKEITFLQE